MLQAVSKDLSWRQQRLQPALAALLLLMPLFGLADFPAGPAALKAALVYKIAQFVEWPAQAKREHFVLCVLGEDPFDGALDQLAGRLLDESPVEVMYFSQSDAVASSCRLLFLGSDKAAFEEEILDLFADRPVLTLGESAAFAEHGGMIQFRRNGKKMGFVINPLRVRRAGLSIAAPLLSMAEIVGNEDSEAHDE